MTRRAGLPILFATLLALAGAPSAGAGEGEAGGRWLILGPDGRPSTAVVLSRAAPGRDGRAVFDATAGGETRVLAGGLLEDEGGEAGTVPVVWGPGLAAAALEREAQVVGLRLGRAEPFGGLLRFERGRAAARIPVFAARPDGAGIVHRTRTDDHGAWRFEHVAAGDWEVTVERGDGRRQTLGVFRAGGTDVERVLEPGSRVEGQLLDGDTIQRTGAGGLRFTLVSLPEAVAGQGEVVQADEEGRFVLDDVPEGVYEARLETEGVFFDPRAPRLEVPARGLVRLRGWYVLHGRRVTGRVEGPRSAKVADALVVLVPDPTLAPPTGGWPPVAPARTDAAGRFVLDGARPATGYRLAVRAEGYAAVVTAPFDVVGPRPTEVPSVLLPSGWRLEARARAPGGAPVPGVTILALPADRPVAEGGPEWEALARRAVTNADGVAVLGDLPAGDVRAFASSPTVVPVSTLVPYPPSGDVRTWIATVFPAADLAGRVEGWAVRQGVALTVRAACRTDGRTRTAAVAPGGTFRFAGLGSDPVDLAVLRADDADGPVLAREEAVVPGEADEVVVTLPEPARITGQVQSLAPDGPPGRVLLEAPLLDPQDDEYRWRTVASVDLPGDVREARYEIAGLSPGTYAVRAAQGDNDSGATTVRLDPEQTEPVDLLLPATGRVAGTVLDERDLPVLGAKITLVRLRGDGDAPGRPGGAPRRSTGNDGAFVFEDVAPGLWRVEARDGDAAPDVEVVRVGEGESVVVRDLLVGRGGVLEGTVSDGEGRRLDGALLVLQSTEDGVGERRARTGRDGFFHVGALRPGTWRVRLAARAGPFTDLEVLTEVVSGETTALTLTATGRARVLGRVWRNGRPVPDLVLHLVSHPEDERGLARRRVATTDAEGRFAFDGLEAGAHTLETYDGAVRALRPLRLDDGDLVTLDLEAWEGRLPGRVHTPAGMAVADATVVARPAGGGPGPRARVHTDPQGRFLIVGLPVGAYDLDVSALALPPTRVEGAVAEVYGAERPVDVEIGRGARLDLQVLTPGGRGLAGARVWLEDEHGTAYHARPYVTGYRGRLLMEGASAGRVWLRVYARGFGRPPRREIRLVDGEETRVEIALPPPARLVVHVYAAGRDRLPRTSLRLLRLPGREPVLEARALQGRRLEPTPNLVPRTGIVAFDDLGPGRYAVLVDAGSGFESAEATCEIGAEDETSLEIELRPVR